MCFVVRSPCNEARVRPPTRGLFKANDCASNAASPVRFRDSAPRRYGSKVEHRSASPTARVRFPLPAPTARCSGSNTVCKIVERGSTPRRASNASARGRDQRLLNAGLRDRHAPEAPRRIRLVAEDAGFSIQRRWVRFPHAAPHLHPRWAAGLRSQLGKFDSSWRYHSSSSSDDRGSPKAAYRVRLPAKRPLGWSNGGSRVSYARNQSVQFRPQQR